MSTVTRVYRNVRGIRTAIKDVGRLRQIAVILSRHGFGALVDQLGIADVIGIRILTHRSAATSELSVAERIRVALEDLGPTFVKLGQIISTRSDLIRPDIIEQLQRLQDDVPPMSWTDVQRQIENALGEPFDTAFAAFDSEPLACASIAQVHRATLRDGREVVVKVQRAGIRDGISADLSIMHFLASRAEQLVSELRMIDPAGIIEEFERAINKELDFTNERHNIEKFRQNFAEFDGVNIPAVYPDYCTTMLLTMEFIRGVKVTRAPEALGVDPYALATTMLEALFKMVFRDGLFHGDLHPGNVLISDDHAINLIDFGLVGRLLPRQREVILDLMLGISNEDYELVSRVLFELGIKMPGVQYDFAAFESDVIDVMDTHLAGKTLDNIEIQGFFRDLVNGAIKHQIKMPPTYTMVFKALMTVEGIGKTLSPKLDFIGAVTPFIKELLLERYRPERLFREGVETLTNVSRSLRSLGQSAPRLLRDLELGRISFRVDSERVDEVVVQLQRSTNRVIRALIFGAAAVAGTLALDAPGTTVLGLPVVAFGAYVIAAFAGLPLVFSLLSRR